MLIGKMKFIRGDIIEDGLSQLVNGVKVDIVCCDPPWNNGIAKMYRKWAGYSGYTDVAQVMNCLRNEICLHCRTAVIIIAIKRIEDIPDFPYTANVFQFHWNSGKSYYIWRGGFIEHPLVNKPNVDNDGDKILEELLKQEKGRVVLDPFIGYGWTARVCKKVGLDCYGMDINKERVDYCIKHYAN